MGELTIRRDRPTKYDAKRQRIDVRLSDEELYALDTICDRYDITYYSLIRMWIKLETSRLNYLDDL